MFLEQRVDLGVVGGHVPEGLPAGGALVGRLDVVVVAARMDTVTAWLLMKQSEREVLDIYSIGGQVP